MTTATMHSVVNEGVSAVLGDALRLHDPSRDELPFVTAFARGLAIIQAFGPNRPDYTLAELAKVTKLPRATVRRCLHTLVSLGFARNTGRYFSLTPKIMSLGYSYLAATPLPSIAQPFLETVSENIGESCSLCVLEGGEILYVARAATRRITSVSLMVGSQLPAFCTAMGRVLLSGLPERELRQKLTHSPLRAYTAQTVTDVEQLVVKVRAVMSDGYALVDQEFEDSLRSIAVPVYGSDGAIVASMNVSAQASRVDAKQMCGPILDALRRGAYGLTAALCPLPAGRAAAG
jgi:IclR family transcriptional regulator, pca regulon regulatory protein